MFTPYFQCNVWSTDHVKNINSRKSNKWVLHICLNCMKLDRKSSKLEMHLMVLGIISSNRLVTNKCHCLLAACSIADIFGKHCPSSGCTKTGSQDLYWHDQNLVFKSKWASRLSNKVLPATNNVSSLSSRPYLSE